MKLKDQNNRVYHLRSQSVAKQMKEREKKSFEFREKSRAEAFARKRQSMSVSKAGLSLQGEKIGQSEPSVMNHFTQNNYQN